MSKGREHFIYKIINNVNGKLYIGLTIDPDRRWRDYLSEIDDHTRPISQAMKKYGIDNFNMEIIHSSIYSEQEALDL